MGQVVLVTRYALISPFEPTSSKQVLDYLRFKGYEIPTNPKTKQPSTDKKSVAKLLRLHPTDPVLQRLKMIRGYSKVIGDLQDTYIHSDGRFHTVFTLDVGTGRMASGAPNLMNQPQGRTEEERERALAQRSSIIPSEGFVLISRDWRAIEAQLVAYFADDPDYARIGLLGSHAYYASHLLGKPVPLSLPDDELGRRFDFIKKTEPIYPLAKKANLALNYGMGPYLLAEELVVEFEEARRLIAVHENMAPKVKAWKEKTRLLAHKERTLRNPFGWVSPYFFDIFRKTARFDEEGRQIWEPRGKQANQVLAFLPQSTGAAMLKEVWLALDDLLRDDHDFHLLIPVHDEILAEARIGTEAKYHALMRAAMERAWPELGGLTIATEGKKGFNWSEAGDDNPRGMRAYVDPA